MHVPVTLAFASSFFGLHSCRDSIAQIGGLAPLAVGLLSRFLCPPHSYGYAMQLFLFRGCGSLHFFLALGMVYGETYGTTTGLFLDFPWRAPEPLAQNVRSGSVVASVFGRYPFASLWLRHAVVLLRARVCLIIVRKDDFTVAVDCIRFVSIRDCTQSINLYTRSSWSLFVGLFFFSLFWGGFCGFLGFSAPLTVTLTS